jgi:hypothetical protein
MSQWVLYRPAVGALLRAQIPTAADVGEGWRGAELRAFGDLAQLDELTADTGAKTGAALGVSVEVASGYLVAAGEGGEVVARLDIGPQPANADQVASFAVWSEGSAPEAVTAEALDVALGAGSDPSGTVNEVLRLLGLALPEGIPHYGSLHEVARENPAPPPKKGIFRRRR